MGAYLGTHTLSQMPPFPHPKFNPKTIAKDLFNQDCILQES